MNLETTIGFWNDPPNNLWHAFFSKAEKFIEFVVSVC